MKKNRGMGCATKGGGCVVKRAGVGSAAEGVTPDMLKWMSDVTKPMLRNHKPKTMETKSGKRLPFEPMVRR